MFYSKLIWLKPQNNYTHKTIYSFEYSEMAHLSPPWFTVSSLFAQVFVHACSSQSRLKNIVKTNKYKTNILVTLTCGYTYTILQL